MNKMKQVFTLIMVLMCAVAQAQEANYDESKVGSYTLPDLLLTQAGKQVTTSEDWENTRRGEILSLFEEHIYGKVPFDFGRIEFNVKNEQADAMDGAALLKEVEITVFRGEQAVLINLTLFIPNNRRGAVPAFLLINNRGVEITDPSRAVKSGFWPAEKLIEAGYAVAAFQVDDAAPDNKDTYQERMLRLYPEQLSADNGIKAIGAWAWAASRVMDYFESDNAINERKVAVVGHSRGGKASLWAAAEDPRFALCISNNSGNSGAALSKRNFGETVAIINTAFPHWFNTNYKKYNHKEHLLPVDQHMLIALIAPRPIYVTSATEDLWADPEGTFLALKSAEPAYELYGLKSQLANRPPEMNSPIYRSPMAYHIREGKHDLTEYDWEQFLKFADHHF